MIIYTPLPIESVLNQTDIEEPNYTEMDYQGKKVIVESIDSYQAKIVRLISSNPNDFLNANYTPGKIIYFRPE
ncbi:YlzJ-like family protein [Desulfuribacillus alkaliarsenatis]|uniref:Uncharacterized protein n=1 Tax=Desulfuribacillus alkaliarsenatis TaxID=766136 RepID=A0A1E5G648_9FIRM|nr:YlzJ-like family protein [Desulfuribacillus alkaliarsenatis]OEF98668.1 hypothetical protein BHF68_03135 [Desulfuribacillus alkaliarsenatis]